MITVAVAGYVASTVFMGGLLVALAVVLVLAGDWRRPGLTPRTETAVEARRGGASASRDARGPGRSSALDGVAAPAVGFLLLVAAVGGSALSLFAGFGTAVALVVLLYVLLSGYAFVGVYLASRHRGRPSARATAEGLGVIATLLLVAVVVKLLTVG